MGYLKLCIDGKVDEVRQRLATLPQCVNWLDPNFKLTPIPNGLSDSDSDSDSDSECDDNMETGSNDDDAPNSISADQRNHRNRPQTDEDGWTTIPSRSRH